MEITEDIKNSPEYIQAVKQNGEEKTQNALDTAVNSPRYQKYKSLQTRRSILLAALNAIGRAVEIDGDSITERVLLLGGGDSHGTKRPVNIIALRSDGTFTTVPLWGTPTFELPCKATITGVFDAKWNSINPAKEGGITDIKPVSIESAAITLNKIAIDPQTPKGQAALENLVRYQYYAVKGKIQWINGSPIFSDSARIGENPLVVTDQHTPPKNHVTCSISLDGNNTGYSVAFQLPRQRHGRPGIYIDDFEDLCYDAVEQYPGIEEDMIKQQCKFVREAVYGREVVGVGQASSIKDVERKNGEKTLYVNLTCGFITELSPLSVELQEREQLFSDSETASPNEIEHVEFQRVKLGNTNTAEEDYIASIVDHCLDIDTSPQILTPKEACKIAEIPDSVGNSVVIELLKIATRKYESMV